SRLSSGRFVGCRSEFQTGRCDLRAERGSERPVIHFESIWVNCSFVNLGLFPVSEVHKLIQNFLQSSEPPFVVGGCPSISPVHLRAVRFTDLGYFFPKFLDTL